MSQMDFVSIVSSAYFACLSREAYEAKAYKAVYSSQKLLVRISVLNPKKKKKKKE